jgi:tetratricopeptide (TPR) repeat protein
MSSAVPTIRQMSWPAVLPQLVAIGAAMGIAYLLGVPDAVLWGAAVYLAYSIGSRQFIARAQRAGIRLVQQERFAEAIPKFQESFEFFERHPWIDRYRSIVLMSPSAMSYREMALANIGFCYGQLGDGERSRAYFQKCLERFPGSGLATAALRMLDSVSPTAAS